MTRVVFDIGGTKMRVARATPEGLGEVRILETPADAGAGMEALTAAIRAEASGAPDAIAGCVAGVFADGVLTRSPNLPGWEGVRLRDALAPLAPRVLIHNDAALACLGEARRGAGRGARICAYIGVGTGVGGARCVDGMLDTLRYNAEPGQQMLTERGETLESLISGGALTRAFGKDSRLIPREEYRRRLPLFAAGIVNAILFWSPDVLVLGGSLMNQADGYELPLLIDEVKKREHMYPKLPDIRLAELADEAGLMGAAELLENV